jgi:hypothetical protein
MTISTEVLVFALNHARTPDEAATLAERLGASMILATPPVCLPPQWILRHYKSSVAQTVFMVNYCDDPEVLDTISQKDKRLGVRTALALNKHLAESTRVALRHVAEQDEQYALCRILDYSPATIAANAIELLEVEIASVLAEHQSDNCRVRYNSVRHKIGGFVANATNADACRALTHLLRGAAKRGVAEPVFDYLAACYQLVERQVNNYSRIRESLSLTEAIKMLPRDRRSAVLTVLLEHAVSQSLSHNNYSYNAPLPLDVEITELLIEYVVPADIDFTDTRGVFTDDAVAMLCVHANWAQALVGEELDDIHFAKLIDAGAPPVHVCYHLQAESNRLIQALTYWPDGYLIWDSRPLELMTACIGNDNAELKSRVIKLCSGELIIEYLTWQLCSLTTKDPDFAIVPDVTEIPGLLELLGNDLEYLGEQPIACITDPTYLCALVDVIPGLAYHNMDNPVVGDYAFARLVQSGLSLELSLEQFEIAQHEPFSRLMAILTSLHALTT